ncbi:hypothetical protein HL658_05295 [Azospirillum sp. RWY-5-1]|uniref:DUF1127 domain-containing protein n=1 Tax=Azospirillum oleiclasticum TaxID=2735135 RepID=A0ABX2T781_9PROT|nr:hypothetical protein [Azospirillum oleiclasticum]NYZ11956.1 hypothetical protein [Azospirillum oleiclasticum]NYZ19116.1 hypothetical protein [Azospirillum oleiclasticum]
MTTIARSGTTSLGLGALVQSVQTFFSAAVDGLRLYRAVSGGRPISNAELNRTGFTREQVAFLSKHVRRMGDC